MRPLDDGRFAWCVGIEDTFIGHPIRHSGFSLDEYELTQHYRFWREDLDRAASLGVSGIRYGIPWYRVNPAPERFDWRWVDDVLDHAVTRRNLTVIADLVHYGVPDWVEGSFADLSYPSAVAAYAAAFAERYRHLVHHYTPLNEPTVTAQFCGQRGLWAPYLTGDEGWLRVVLGAVEGIRASVAAIRAVDPAAVIVHVEAAKVVRCDDDALASAASHLRERAYLPTDLLLGRVSPAHPLSEWAVERGAPIEVLDRMRQRPVSIDVVGVNYYPEISVRQVLPHAGVAAEVAVDGWASGLEEALLGFHQRYGLPILVSETSTEGDDDRRIRWLDDAVAVVDELRRGGVPLVGFTWWPLFDFVDWSHSLGQERLEEFLVREPDGAGGWRLVPPFQPSDAARREEVDHFLRRMGLWRLEGDTEGTLRRVESAAAIRYRQLVTREYPSGDPPPGSNTG